LALIALSGDIGLCLTSPATSAVGGQIVAWSVRAMSASIAKAGIAQLNADA
jgi:hypothetical protein